jgi:Fe-S cluster assembly protein SufA/iron-sulfur cluster assembly protein
MQIYDPKQPISITAKARDYLTRQLQQHTEAQAVRLSIKTTGCSGYQYHIDWVSAPQNQDIAISLSSSQHLYVDAAAIAILQGTEIDLVKEGLNESIEFKNPNVTARCGCGESFSITDQEPPV